MASVRRFNQKIGFGCLKPDGNMIFYQKLLCGLCKTPVNRNQEELIGRIHDLTPGDFRIVRDRFAISDEKCVTHEQMIQALEAEARVKKTQQGNRPIGFMRRTA